MIWVRVQIIPDTEVVLFSLNRRLVRLQHLNLTPSTEHAPPTQHVHPIPEYCNVSQRVSALLQFSLALECRWGTMGVKWEENTACRSRDKSPFERLGSYRQQLICPRPATARGPSGPEQCIDRELVVDGARVVLVLPGPECGEERGQEE